MEDDFNKILENLANAFDAFLGGNYMRCKICDHVLEEKDGVQHHKLKYYDSLHQPQIQGEMTDIENLSKDNLVHAFENIKEHSIEEIPNLNEMHAVIEEDSALTEVFGSNDAAEPAEKMRIISEALKKYYGGDDWLERRNSKQPGLGR